MDTPALSTEVVHDFIVFKVFSDGHVEKLYTSDKIPPTDDPKTGVKSKDVIMSPEVSIRMFLPKITSTDDKLPILIQIHGGGFACGSAFCSVYHSYVSVLASETRAICISVEYRLVPENSVTACYDDCWTVLQWVLSHASGDGVEPWLNQHADFSKLFIGGDSAGGNLAYNLIVQAGKSKLPAGVKLIGTVLVDPYFSGSTHEIDQMWMYVCPDNKGLNDPRIEPDESDLKLIPSERLLVFVAENDNFNLRDRGYAFVEELKSSGWTGKVDIFESLGEGHCFHLHGDLFRPAAAERMKRFTSFINDF